MPTSNERKMLSSNEALKELIAACRYIVAAGRYLKAADTYLLSGRTAW